MPPSIVHQLNCMQFKVICIQDFFGLYEILGVRCRTDVTFRYELVRDSALSSVVSFVRFRLGSIVGMYCRNVLFVSYTWRWNRKH